MLVVPPDQNWKWWLLSVALLVVVFQLQPSHATALKVGFVYLSEPSDLGWTFEHDQGSLPTTTRTCRHRHLLNVSL